MKPVILTDAAFGESISTYHQLFKQCIPAVPRSQPSSSRLWCGATSAQLKAITSSQTERFSPLESSEARYWIKQTLQPVTASAQPLLTHRQESWEWAGYCRLWERKDLRDVLWAGLDLWQICLTTSNLLGDRKRANGAKGPFYQWTNRLKGLESAIAWLPLYKSFHSNWRLESRLSA